MNRPKPTVLKLLAGNPSGHKDRLNPNEPKPQRLLKLPHCPSHLTGEARQAWRDYGPLLIKTGVLTVNDMGAFEQLCEARGRWRELADQVRKEGSTIIGTKGGLIINPIAVLADKAFRDYRFMSSEFGLTPSSRSRVVGVGTQDDAEDLDQVPYFDERAANSAANFFPKYLHHVKGEWAGQPFELQPWQHDLTRQLFGSLEHEGGPRQYRRAFVEVGRKNGKTSYAAGIGLKLLTADGEPGAEIYSCAADRDQARLCFSMAQQFVEHSPQLRSRCRIYRDAIPVPKTGSSYKVLSAEAYSKHGVNAHGIIFDELHAQPNRELWDVMNTSTGARRQPLVIAITTAGHDRHSICWEQREYARRILAGEVIDPAFLPVLFEAPIDSDWKDPEVWALANPSLGATIKLEYLKAECQRAIDIPAYENTFRTLHLCQWVEQETRWLPMADWDACGSPVDPGELEGRECFGGLDLASTQDLSALVLAFPGDDGSVAVLPFFWVPEEGARKRADKDHVPYQQWIRQGVITATPGDVADYDRIRADIRKLGEVFNIREIAYDRWNASHLVTQLTGDGLEMFPIGQGFQSLTAPSKELEKLVVGHQLRHGGNPVMRWMAGNVAAETDAAGNLKPSKKKSSEKIDGIVALIMALSRLITRPEREGSIYETRGIDTVPWR